MAITIERMSGGAVARLPKHFSGATVRELIDTVGSAIVKDQLTRLTVDFSETVFVDSYGIGILVSIAKQLQAKGGALAARNLTGELRELFEETGLDQILLTEKAGGQADIFRAAVDIRLDIREETEGDVRVLHLSGVMSHPSGSNLFKRTFLLALADYKKVLVDMEDLTFFDSVSVSVLLGMNKLARETGGDVRLCGANTVVLDVFSALNLDKVIPLYETRAQALCGWQ